MRLYRNEGWLREQYLVNRFSCRQIGEISECSTTTIFSWLKRFEIPRRTDSESITGLKRSDASKKRYSAANKRKWSDPEYKKRALASRNPPMPYQDKEWLVTEYIGKQRSILEMATEMHCCGSTISTWLKRHNIPIRSLSECQKLNLKRHPEIVTAFISRISGLPRSHESRIKQSNTMQGRKLSQEHADKIRACSKVRKLIPGYLEKQSAKKKGENNPAWKGGVSFEPYCLKFNDEFKESVRSKFNHRCYACDAKQRKRKLSVHHIDYNKNDICNGKDWSFVPLCAKHHSLSNFNRWYWFNLLIYYWSNNSDINFNCYPMEILL